MNSKLTYLTAACLLLGAEAFVPTTTTTASIRSTAGSTELHFGLPSFEPKKEGDGEEKDDKKINAKGMIQLITAGLGAPFLGDFQGVDKESGKFMFSLEANNLVDKDGNSKQTSMPYFESGWVDPKDLEKEERKKSDGFKFPWQN
jgi:hypothetical protein